MTIGSTVGCGMAPWPPLPLTTMSTDVDVGHRRARAIADLARGQVVRQCRARAKSGLGNRVKRPSSSIALAPPTFLGRLADEHERALPAVLVLGQPAGRADQAGHVHVVAAGVHDADLVARRRRVTLLA